MDGENSCGASHHGQGFLLINDTCTPTMCIRGTYNLQLDGFAVELDGANFLHDLE